MLYIDSILKSFIQDELPALNARESPHFKRKNIKKPTSFETFNLPYSLIHDRKTHDCFVLLKKWGTFVAVGSSKKITKAVYLPQKVVEKATLCAQSVSRDDCQPSEIDEAKREQNFHRILNGARGIWRFIYGTSYKTEKNGKSFEKVTSFTELAKGDLQQVAKDLKFDAFLVLAEDIIRGLAFMHEQKIVHGDITSNNVLVSQDGSRAGLIDFAVSFRCHIPDKPRDFEDIGDGDPPTFPFVLGSYGTARYTAPELVKAKRFRGNFFKTDVWALGQTLFETLFNKTCNLQDQSVYEREIARPRELLEKQMEPHDRRQAFMRLLFDMLCRDPTQRPSIHQILTRFETMRVP